MYLKHLSGSLEVGGIVTPDGHQRVEHFEKNINETLHLADGEQVQVVEEVCAKLDNKLGRCRVRRQKGEVVRLKGATPFERNKWFQRE